MSDDPRSGKKPTTTGNNPAVKPSQMKTQKIPVPLVRADVMVLTGDLAGRRFTIDRSKTVIGRDPEGQIQLTGNDVSRQHAIIGHTLSGEFVIEDLKSRNGTLVNGVPIEVHVLKFGDKIQIGSRTLFVFTHHQALEEQLVQWQRIELIAQMTAGLVHDFNNYMTALLGYIQYMQDSTASKNLSREELLELLDNCLPVMDSAAREGSNLARKVLTFARGSSRPQIPVDLSPVVKEALALVQPSFKKPIKVTHNLAQGLRVIGERTEVLQVLINLFLNARDAMPEGGTLHIEGEVCHVDGDQALALQANEQVVIRVADSGIGMDEETQKRIFEPMFTTKAASKGTGLGLSMVSRIIEAHGGMIRVESQPDKGTIFTIYLPVADARLTPLKVNTTMVMKHLKTQPGEIRESGLVLLQEDDEVMRQRAARALCSLGYEVLFASTVEEVYELFEGYSGRVKLVVLNATEMGKADVIRTRLRKSDPTVKVLFTSREGDELLPHRVKARLTVPCDTRSFQSVVREVMKEEDS